VYSGRNWRFGQIGYCVLRCLRPTYVLEDKVCVCVCVCFIFIFIYFYFFYFFKGLLILHLLNVIRFVDR
jgi:hypothetical protein